MNRFVPVEKTCSLWPHCGCRDHLVTFDRLLDDEQRIWEPEELSGLETVLYFTLLCVSSHCPDKRHRRAAEIELMKPYWDNQRAGLVIGEGFRRVPVERRRA
jgi:hypothetical protein